jgi:hypothetical protein
LLPPVGLPTGSRLSEDTPLAARGEILAQHLARHADPGPRTNLGWLVMSLAAGNLACRTTERLTAQWPAGDKYFKPRKDRAKKELPAAPTREVRHIVLEDGKIIGYSGVQPVPPGSSVWTERCRQVWQDVRQAIVTS